MVSSAGRAGPRPAARAARAVPVARRSAWPWLLFALPVAVLLTGCSGSRLWRISPWGSDEAPGDERFNGFPLIYSDGDAASVLWPLIDVDDHGFAVRPLVSRDRDDLDVLFPLSHVDLADGTGWILTGYRTDASSGLFPLFHLGPEFNFVGPYWWWEADGAVDASGLFPLAWFDDDRGNGLLLNAYSWHGNRGLFPLCNFGPEWNWVGPAWWRSDASGVTDWSLLPLGWHDLGSGDGFLGPAYAFGENVGLFPLFHSGPRFDSIGPFWRAGGADADDDSAWGAFPLVWSATDRDAATEDFGVLPLFWRHAEPDHDWTAALLPPTWWETQGETQRRFVLPFYVRLADGDCACTIVPPLYASLERDGSSHWYTPLANGWRDEQSSGLNLYPFWWSSESDEATTRALLPLFLSRERGDERLFLTPLGGRGWDATGTTGFTNLLGPLFHHSRSPDHATTALAWPLFQHDRTATTTETRLFPLFDVATTPTGHDAFALAGLLRHVVAGDERSLRLWPLWSDREAAAPPDLLFDLTLAGRHVAGATWSTHLFPLWSAGGDEERSKSSALLGLARLATTEAGHAWRVWPLASGSSDASADGWLDPFTLWRSTQRGEERCDRLFPLASVRRDGEEAEISLLGSLARLHASAEGTSARLLPLFSKSSGPADKDLLDWISLVGVHPRRGGTDVHFATPLVFDLHVADDSPSWRARLLTLFSCRHEEFDISAVDVGAPPQLVERDRVDFLFGWMKNERTVLALHDGSRREEVHRRLPLLFEFERAGDRREWDALLWAVHSVATPHEERFSVLGYGYRSVRTGESTRRDIFPFITCDDAPGRRRFSFLGRLFSWQRDGEKVGGTVLFLPWGDTS